MRTTRPVWIVLAFSLLYPVSAFGQDQWEGFRGIKWGTTIDAVENMKLVDTKGDTKQYQRKADKLKIGGAELKAIRYFFYKDQFYGVGIIATGYSNGTALKDAIFATFGKGRKQNQFIDQWVWITLDTGKKTLLILARNRTIEEWSLHITYEPIAAQERVDKDRAAQNAKGDF